MGWLHEGETGLLVMPGGVGGEAEALSSVLRDRWLPKRLGDKVRRRTARCSRATHLTNLEDIDARVIRLRDTGSRQPPLLEAGAK